MTRTPLPLLRAASFTCGSLLVGLAHGQDAASEEARSPAAVCAEHHEQAQVARLDGRLLDSKSRLMACASDLCPSFVRSDCVGWLDEVRSEIPTVIFDAQGDGGSLVEVQVSHEGTELTTRLDGRPLEMDPGPYTFEFRLDSGETKSVRAMLRQGEKNKLISVDFRTAREPTGGIADSPRTSPSQEESRPVPTSVYVFGAVAAAGAASFAGFGIVAKMKERDALDSCAPHCSSSVVDDIRTFALVADLSLGVAVASAATATVLYLTRPSVVNQPAEMARRRPLEPVVAPTLGGGWLGFNGVF